jgi:hypothetical protein
MERLIFPQTAAPHSHGCLLLITLLYLYDVKVKDCGYLYTGAFLFACRDFSRMAGTVAKDAIAIYQDKDEAVTPE